jgi:methionyl-tRNA formyltransferase
LMKIDQQIDHGPIIGQEKIKISPDETGQSLREKINLVALKLVQKNLADYLAGKIPAQPQDHSQATFTPLIRKEAGEIDWEKPIEHIERKIRAFNPWPGSYTQLNNQIFKIYSAKIKKGKLHLGQVQLSGRKKMSFQSFKQGYQGRLDFSDKIA